MLLLLLAIRFVLVYYHNPKQRGGLRSESMTLQFPVKSSADYKEIARTWAITGCIIASAVKECGPWQPLEGAGTWYMLRVKAIFIVILERQEYQESCYQ